LIEADNHREAELIVDAALQMRKKGHEQMAKTADPSLSGEALAKAVEAQLADDHIFAYYRLSAAYTKLGVDKYADSEELYAAAIPVYKVRPASARILPCRELFFSHVHVYVFVRCRNMQVRIIEM
jgi:TPP-dependent pyruvate/acetoin dehydrogenase alpha subunit